MQRLFNLLALAASVGLIVFLAAAAAFADPQAKGIDPIVEINVGGGYCTAFAAQTQKFGLAFITAGHCAVDMLQNGNRATFDNAGKKADLKVVAFDAAEDVAILSPQQSSIALDHTLDLGCGEKVTVGDNVTITGYPLDFGRVVTKGYIAAEPSPWLFWPEVYRVDIFAGPGNSGSPVQSANGHVMGILVGGNPNWPGMSMVVPIAEVCVMAATPAVS